MPLFRLLLEAIEFAISLATIVPLIINIDRTTKLFVGCVGIFSLTAVFGALVYQHNVYERRVTRMSEDVLNELSQQAKAGKQAVPFDDLSHNFFKVDIPLESDVLDRLDDDRVIGTKLLRLHDDPGNVYEIWGFYVKPH